MVRIFPRSNSLPAQTDEYGIGFASDSDSDGEGGAPHHLPSMPNLSRAVLSSASSMARTASPDGGDVGGDWGPEGTDLHVFFIWVDPADPCADRLVEWPLPEKYQTHVRRWEERYQVPLPSTQAQDAYLASCPAAAAADVPPPPPPQLAVLVARGQALSPGTACTHAHTVARCARA